MEKILELLINVLSDEGATGTIAKIASVALGFLGFGGLWAGFKAVVFGLKSNDKLESTGFYHGVRLSKLGNSKLGKIWELIEDKIYIPMLCAVSNGLRAYIRGQKRGLKADG